MVSNISGGKREVQENQTVETRKRSREMDPKLEEIQNLAQSIQADAKDLDIQPASPKKIKTLQSSQKPTDTSSNLNLKHCDELFMKTLKNYKSESLTIEEPEFDSSSLQYLAKVNELKRLSINIPKEWLKNSKYLETMKSLAAIPLLEELDIKSPLKLFHFESLICILEDTKKLNQIQKLSLTFKIIDLELFADALYTLISDIKNLKELKLEFAFNENYELSQEESNNATFLKNLKLDNLKSLKKLEKFELVNSMTYTSEDLDFLKQFPVLTTFKIGGKEVPFSQNV